MKRMVGGGCLIFFGLFMLMGFFASTSPSSFFTSVMLLLLFVFAPVVAGALVIRSHYQSKKKAAEESRKNILASREKEILKLAKAKDGELTIQEIVAETSMNAEEADEIMRELVVKRYVDMNITNQGGVVYEFFDMKRDQDRDRLTSLPSWTDDRDVN